jgi:hypothetical protein
MFLLVCHSHKLLLAQLTHLNQKSRDPFAVFIKPSVKRQAAKMKKGRLLAGIDRHGLSDRKDFYYKMHNIVYESSKSKGVADQGVNAS